MASIINWCKHNENIEYCNVSIDFMSNLAMKIKQGHA